MSVTNLIDRIRLKEEDSHNIITSGNTHHHSTQNLMDPSGVNERRWESETGAAKASTSFWLSRVRILEAVLLSCVILFIWGLFSVPTILYILRPLQKTHNHSSNSHADTHANGSICLSTAERQSTTDGEFSITCAEGFYLDNSSDITAQCIPLCDFWAFTSESSIYVTVGFIVRMILRFASSIIIFVMALGPQRDAILVYPTVYLIYTCVVVVVTAPVQLAGSLGGKKLICNSDSFLENLENPSPFCTIRGVTDFYVFLQISLWRTFHTLGLCWSIVFPFHYRRFKTEGKIKYIHASSIVLGFVLPSIPALLPLIVDGYVIIPGQHVFCTGSNIAIMFFLVVFPVSILVATSTTMLVLIFWKIFKEFILKRLQDVKTSSSSSHIKTAEIKILFIVCYYILLGVVALSIYSLISTTNDINLDAYQDYFLCHSAGKVSDMECGDPPNLRLQAFTNLLSTAFILESLSPTIILIFIVKCNVKLCSRHTTKENNY